MAEDTEESENISEAFGMLIGLIQINGEHPEKARSKVLKEGYPVVEVDHLLEEHWDYTAGNGSE